MQVELLKARARCHRFSKEIRLIKEEQRRTLVSLEKGALDWDARVFANHENDPIVRDGLVSYAAKQADLRRSLVQSFQHLWGIPITEVVQYTMDEGTGEGDAVMLVDDQDEGNEGIVMDSDSEDDEMRLKDDSDDE